MKALRDLVKPLRISRSEYFLPCFRDRVYNASEGMVNILDPVDEFIPSAEILPSEEYVVYITDRTGKYLPKLICQIRPENLRFFIVTEQNLERGHELSRHGIFGGFNRILERLCFLSRRKCLSAKRILFRAEMSKYAFKFFCRLPGHKHSLLHIKRTIDILVGQLDDLRSGDIACLTEIVIYLAQLVCESAVLIQDIDEGRVGKPFLFQGLSKVLPINLNICNCFAEIVQLISGIKFFAGIIIVEFLQSAFRDGSLNGEFFELFRRHIRVLDRHPVLDHHGTGRQSLR